jgi:hypothetical protein
MRLDDAVRDDAGIEPHPLRVGQVRAEAVDGIQEAGGRCGHLRSVTRIGIGYVDFVRSR